MAPGAVESYLVSAREQFRVAEAAGAIIGTVALAELTRDIAQLRSVRVAAPWQDGHAVAKGLIRAAAAHATEMRFLKLTLLAAAAAQSVAATYFRLLGFEFSRDRP